MTKKEKLILYLNLALLILFLIGLFGLSSFFSFVGSSYILPLFMSLIGALVGLGVPMSLKLFKEKKAKSLSSKVLLVIPWINLAFMLGLMLLILFS